MYDILCRLKLPSLNDTRKEAKVRYQRALQEYSLNCMGRPLEDLHVSFAYGFNFLSATVIENKLRCKIYTYPVKQSFKILEFSDWLPFKLQNFFEQVQGALDSGVRPDAICYQFAFQKHMLQKIIKEYPGKEVSCSIA